MQLTGALTALVTPFTNGKVDEERYRAFIEWQIEQGIDGVVPCGTTGESATLSPAEHEKVIAICIDQVKKRVPVIAGAGSNSTAESIHLTAFAKKAGADAALLITPYYNKPTQEGLVAHFKAVAKEVSMPMLVYNVPSRTGVNVQPTTMARLFKEIPEVFGAKEATADLTQISAILELCGDTFTLLSGDDFTVLPTIAVGGKGVISVVSNLVPKAFSELCRYALQGDYAKARELHYQMQPLCRACFLETNPIPVKLALAAMGKMEPELRLPLVPLSPENNQKLQATLKDAGLL